MAQPSKPALKRFVNAMLNLGQKLEDTGECGLKVLSATQTMTPADSMEAIRFLLNSSSAAVSEFLEGQFTDKEISRVQEALQRLHEAIGGIAAGMEGDDGKRLKDMFPMRFTFKNEGISGKEHTQISRSDDSFSARQLTTQDLLAKPKFNQSYRSRDHLKAEPLPPVASTDRVSGIGASSNTPLSIRSHSRVIAAPSQEDLAPPPEEINREQMLPEFLYFLIAACSLAITIFLFNHLMGFFRHDLFWQVSVPLIGGMLIFLRFAFKYNLTYMKIGIAVLLVAYGSWLGVTKRREIQDMAIIQERIYTTENRMKRVSAAIKRYYTEKGEMPRSIDQLLEPSTLAAYWVKGQDEPARHIVDPFSPEEYRFLYHRTRDQFILQSVGPRNDPRVIDINSMVQEDAPLWQQLQPLTYDPINGTYSNGNLFITNRE